MSRIGRKPISLPSGVTVTAEADRIVVAGPKGQLTVPLHPGLSVVTADGEVKIERVGDTKEFRAKHGLVRSLLNNAIIGVHTGYKKTLKLIGTGYRVTMKGSGISLALGFSHPVEVSAPAGLKLSIDGNDTIYIEGIDKQAVGQLAANIREIKPPEPYKGKGIRYEDEVVRRKQGKAAA